MKRIFLFALIFLISLMGVFAVGETAFTAVQEPVLTQQSLGQYLDITEIAVVSVGPVQADFSPHVRNIEVSQVLGIVAKPQVINPGGSA